jgi:hypothetical protein
MKITHYSFGKIIIDEATYTSDVIVYPDFVDSHWWRKEGHYLQVADLDRAIKLSPDMLIIGTGHSGVMVVPEQTTKFIKSKGIELRIAKTADAVDLYNKMQREKKVIAALHLTC